MLFGQKSISPKSCKLWANYVTLPRKIIMTSCYETNFCVDSFKSNGITLALYSIDTLGITVVNKETISILLRLGIRDVSVRLL